MNHEDLEQVEQDAKRFMWCLMNHKEAAVLFRRVPNGGHRFAVDQRRLEPANPLLDAPGGRYDGHMDADEPTFTAEQWAYGCGATVSSFLANDPGRKE